MIVAIWVAVYFGLAVVIARFLGMNTRWERAIGSLIEADGSRLAVAPARGGMMLSRPEEGLGVSGSARREVPCEDEVVEVGV